MRPVLPKPRMVQRGPGGLRVRRERPAAAAVPAKPRLLENVRDKGERGAVHVRTKMASIASGMGDYSHPQNGSHV